MTALSSASLWGSLRRLFRPLTLTLSVVQVAVLGVSLFSQVSLARHFGASHELDRFYAVLGVAMGVIGSLGVGINYILPPKLVRLVVSGQDGEAAVQAGKAIVAMGICILLVALIGGAGMLVVAGYSPISGGGGSIVATVAAGWTIAMGSAAATILTATAAAHQRLLVPLCSSLLPPLCLFLALSFVPHPGAMQVLLGMLFGTVLQCCILAFHVRAFVRFERPWFAWGHREFGSLMLATFGAVCFSGYSLVDALLAPHMGSGVLTLQALGQRLVIAFGAVLTAGAFSLAPADFGRKIEQREHAAAGRGLNRTAFTLIGLSLGAALFTPLIGRPVLRILFVGGSFGLSEVDALVGVVSVLLVGAGAMLATAIGFRLLYAMSKGRLVVIASLLWLALYSSIATALWLLTVPNALSISYAISWWAVFGVMMFLAHAQLRGAARS